MTTDAYREFTRLMASRDHAGAAALAEAEASRRSGGDPFWLTQLARARLAAGRFDEAREASEGALASDPVNPYALLARADALRRLDRVAEAAADYESAAGSPRTAQRAREGVFACLASGGDWTGLLARLDAWADEGGEFAAWRVRALRGLGRTGEALEACRAWLEREKDLPVALWELVELEVESEGLEAVEARYGRISRIPSRPAVYREIHASLLRRTGQADRAVEAYQALADRTADPRHQRRAAFALAKGGREAEAIPLLEELLRESPADRYLLASYEGACRRSGALERAYAFYTDLLARHPDQKALYGRRRRIGKRLEAQGET